MTKKQKTAVDTNPAAKSVTLSKYQKRVMRRMIAGAPVFSKTDGSGGVMRLSQSADSFKPVGKRTLEALARASLVKSRREAALLMWTTTEVGRNSPDIVRD